MSRLSKVKTPSLERVVSMVGMVAAVLVFGMMLVTSFDVLSRKFANAPLGGTWETVTFMLVGVVFLGIAHVQKFASHISMEFVATRLSDTGQGVLSILACLVSIAVYGLIVYATWLSAWDSWSVRASTGGIPDLPIYPAKLAVPFGAGLYCVVLVFKLVRELKTFFKLH